MAKVTIEHNEQTDITADAEFDFLGISFSELKGFMGIKFNGETRPGQVDLLEVYNSMTTTEKAAILKFMKMMTVNCFNTAMGTSFTWDQVPNSVFTPEGD